MGLDICIQPLISTIGNVDDYNSQEHYQCELAMIKNLINVIKSKINEQTNKPVNWNEEEIDFSKLPEGNNFFCERIGNYNLIHHLRRYALHIDINGKLTDDFSSLLDPCEDKLLLKIYDEELKTNFPHLIDHSDCDGYYIPVEFSTPVWIKPSEIDIEDDDSSMLISIGSSINLLKELEFINKHLQVDISDLSDLEIFSGKIAGDELEFVKWCWGVLYQMSVNSIKYSQPIVFC